MRGFVKTYIITQLCCLSGNTRVLLCCSPWLTNIGSKLSVRKYGAMTNYALNFNYALQQYVLPQWAGTWDLGTGTWELGPWLGHLLWLLNAPFHWDFVYHAYMYRHILYPFLFSHWISCSRLFCTAKPLPLRLYMCTDIVLWVVDYEWIHSSEYYHIHWVIHLDLRCIWLYTYDIVCLCAIFNIFVLFD